MPKSKRHRYQVRVTYVLSRTYTVVAEDEDEAEGIALSRTPKTLIEADAEVTQVDRG